MMAAATNRAADPNPGVWSWTFKSLSIVLGTWNVRSSYLAAAASSFTIRAASAESFPPM